MAKSDGGFIQGIWLEEALGKSGCFLQGFGRRAAMHTEAPGSSEKSRDVGNFFGHCVPRFGW